MPTTPALRTLEPGAYFGATESLYERAGLHIAQTCFAPNLVIPPHEHANPFFCFVLAGRGTRSWDAQSGDEAAMHLTLFPAEVPHANCWYGAGGRVLHVEFADRWLKELGAQQSVLKQPGDFSAGAPIWFAKRLTEELQSPDVATPLAAEGLVLELLAACARTRLQDDKGRAPRWLSRVREQLHDRLNDRMFGGSTNGLKGRRANGSAASSDANYSIEALARSVDVSADHLARVFRRHHGCTIGEYLRRLKIDFARRQLIQSDESIANIAAAAGFVDQSHFTRQFRSHTGYTPAHFRALHGKDRLRAK